MLKSLLLILKHLAECGKSHIVHGRALGLLHLVLELGLYNIYFQGLYPARAQDPGQVPFYAASNTRLECKRIEDLFEVQYRKHHDEHTMDESLIERFYSESQDTYAQDITERMMRVARPTFRQVFAQAINKWGTRNSNSRVSNKATML